MDALKAAVIGMGVLIVIMMGAVVYGLARRGPERPAPAALAANVAANVTLGEPAGTHIAGMAPAGQAVAVLLQGGGPDRIVLLSGRGEVVGRVALGR